MLDAPDHFAGACVPFGQLLLPLEVDCLWADDQHKAFDSGGSKRRDIGNRADSLAEAHLVSEQAPAAVDMLPQEPM